MECIRIRTRIIVGFIPYFVSFLVLSIRPSVSRRKERNKIKRTHRKKTLLYRSILILSMRHYENKNCLYMQSTSNTNVFSHTIHVEDRHNRARHTCARSPLMCLYELNCRPCCVLVYRFVIYFRSTARSFVSFLFLLYKFVF